MDWNTALLLLSACVSCSLSLPVSEAQPDSDPFYYGRHYGHHYGHGYGGYRRYGYGHHGHYGYRQHGYGYGYGRQGKSFSHGSYYGGYKQHIGKYGYKILNPEVAKPEPLSESVSTPELIPEPSPVPSPLPAPVPIKDIDLPQGQFTIQKPITRIDPSQLTPPGLVVPVKTNQLEVPVNKLATPASTSLLFFPGSSSQFLPVPAVPITSDSAIPNVPVSEVPVRSVQRPDPIVPEEREVFVPEFTSFTGLEPVPAVPGLPVLSK